MLLLLFLGAKAPLGPLQFVKVKDKRKSFKIEYVAGLARKLMLLFNILTSCIERVSKVVSWVFNGCFKGVSIVLIGCYKGVPRIF